MSVYFITEPTVFIWNGFQWLVLECLQVFTIPYAMLSGSLLSTARSFQLLYRNPPVSCRIHFRVLVSKFFDNEPIYAFN
jgi:hypothetical protein